MSTELFRRPPAARSRSGRRRHRDVHRLIRLIATLSNGTPVFVMAFHGRAQAMLNRCRNAAEVLPECCRRALEAQFSTARVRSPADRCGADQPATRHGMALASLVTGVAAAAARALSGTARRPRG